MFAEVPAQDARDAAEGASGKAEQAAAAGGEAASGAGGSVEGEEGRAHLRREPGAGGASWEEIEAAEGLRGHRRHAGHQDGVRPESSADRVNEGRHRGDERVRVGLRSGSGTDDAAGGRHRASSLQERSAADGERAEDDGETEFLHSQDPRVGFGKREQSLRQDQSQAEVSPTSPRSGDRQRVSVGDAIAARAIDVRDPSCRRGDIHEDRRGINDLRDGRRERHVSGTDGREAVHQPGGGPEDDQASELSESAAGYREEAIAPGAEQPLLAEAARDLAEGLQERQSNELARGSTALTAAEDIRTVEEPGQGLFPRRGGRESERGRAADHDESARGAAVEAAGRRQEQFRPQHNRFLGGGYGRPGRWERGHHLRQSEVSASR